MRICGCTAVQHNSPLTICLGSAMRASAQPYHTQLADIQPMDFILEIRCRFWSSKTRQIKGVGSHYLAHSEGEAGKEVRLSAVSAGATRFVTSPKTNRLERGAGAVDVHDQRNVIREAGGRRSVILLLEEIVQGAARVVSAP